MCSLQLVGQVVELLVGVGMGLFWGVVVGRGCCGELDCLGSAQGFGVLNGLGT